MGKKHYNRGPQDERRPVFRLAQRHEGAFLNTYLAQNETMKDAMLIGSIRFAVVKASDTAREVHMRLMQVATVHFAKLELGVDLEIGEIQAAPEHERAGHA